MGELPCSSIRNAVLPRRIPADHVLQGGARTEHTCCCCSGRPRRSAGAVTLMLVLTIGWAATATPVASPPIEVLPVPAVYAPSPPPKPAIHEIIASWHARGFAGRPTTSGEPFDPRRLAAASTSVPLGSVMKVGKSARQRLRSLCGRSEPRPFTARRAKNRHRPARSSAPESYPD